ncbi:MAG: xanthine dehydrogenase family protein molybdopterin-binding subunit [Gammaproteobacteria bacterium]|nr:xanthine dehydrogenase family protein molybdopterin-binding subunit [Gammaproteobacteria bacterium]MDH4316690.1 xanthine dehydrogenase family protein molybdopterin-binding subunit [Gammaproteobacteria bacterium]MDH5212846.1 xanthine dehydrogenase family protein molybdopterin-binding subunit [Gammaproteobacteria bacterium]
MGKFGTGQAIRRREDQRFITGTGRYTDDITLPGQTYLYIFRSPYAHGLIRSIDVSAAKSLPGVIAVYTGDDLAVAGVRDVTGADLPAFALSGPSPALKQPPLARDRVRYVGEPLAGIVAESINAAKDAAELIELDLEDIQAAVTTADALHDDAARIHDHLDSNLYGVLHHGDRSETDAIFEKAPRIVSIDLQNNRIAPTALEPRGCNVDYDSKTGMMTVYQGCQGVHVLRDRILKSVDLDPEKLHVISPDVGGAFGLKFFLQCETVVAVFASKTLGKPVKWMADRSESFLSDVHGRDHVTHAELAIRDDGRFLAARINIEANLGAYCSQAGPLIPWFGACMSGGCYDIPQLYAEVRMVITNTVPVDAYRGAGRPEAAYVIERLVDRAARQLNMAPDDIRRLNFVRPEQFPYRTATGQVYDSGDYQRLLDAALARADWSGFPARRKASIANGKLRGIGLSYYVEICSAMGGESAHVMFERNGRVTVLVGTQASGQGHETSFAQMVAAGLGVEMDIVDVIQGDSKRVPTGEGTGGSRSMAIGGSSLYRGVDSLVASGSKMAAELFEASVADIEFDSGEFRIAGTDRRMSIAEVAAASFDDKRRVDGVNPGLRSSERFTPEGGTFPNGCHVCEVEVDPDTGHIDILKYTVEDDVGTVINPLILEGQIVGGVAQGLGQALAEHAVYDRDSGQLVTASFIDYTMPRADWLPDVDFRYQELPSPRNPLGVKGAGEAGTVGAAPAVVNAVLDALAARGVDHIDMPLNPLKVWELLQGHG